MLAECKGRLEVKLKLKREKSTNDKTLTIVFNVRNTLNAKHKALCCSLCIYAASMWAIVNSCLYTSCNKVYVFTCIKQNLSLCL